MTSAYCQLDVAIDAALATGDARTLARETASLLELFDEGKEGAANALAMALGSAVPALREAAWAALNDYVTRLSRRRAGNKALMTRNRRKREELLAQIDLLEERDRLAGDVARIDVVQADIERLRAMEKEIQRMADFIEHRDYADREK